MTTKLRLLKVVCVREVNFFKIPTKVDLVVQDQPLDLITVII